MTQAFDDIAVAEQARIESHLPPDPLATVKAAEKWTEAFLTVLRHRITL